VIGSILKKKIRMDVRGGEREKIVLEECWLVLRANGGKKLGEETGKCDKLCLDGLQRLEEGGARGQTTRNMGMEGGGSECLNAGEKPLG